MVTRFRPALACSTAVLLLALAAPGSASEAPAVPDETVGGSLTCAGGQVVWLTERTSAGATTIRIGSFISRQNKVAWSTTTIRSSLTSAVWQVTSTGTIDRSTTKAYCGP